MDCQTQQWTYLLQETGGMGGGGALFDSQSAGAEQCVACVCALVCGCVHCAMCLCVYLCVRVCV